MTLRFDAEGGVEAGTVPALVERLTTPGVQDPRFVKTFFLTYKSFVTLDELFDLLVQRFDASSDSPTDTERRAVQTRVLDTFEALVTDDSVFEVDDMHILDRMKKFLQQEGVSTFPASARLLAWIDHPEWTGPSSRTPSDPLSPPAPIIPVLRDDRPPTLLDIDSLELARQLTLVENLWYQQLRPAEWLARSRDSSTQHSDNIAQIIKVTNGIASWVTETILSNSVPRAQANFIRQFIIIADKCRSLQNYSSMVAILSGLNTIRQQVTPAWDQISARYRAQLDLCEGLIDTANNFAQYHATLASIAPPCVPFIGVSLLALASVRDGNEDVLPGSLINFRKCQEISKIIQDAQRWQVHPHNFHLVPVVRSYIEESLKKSGSQTEARGHLDDEGMARVLQERDVL